jgi:hypothetical protein
MSKFTDLKNTSLVAWVKADDAAWSTADKDAILASLEKMQPDAVVVYLPSGLRRDGSQRFGYPRRFDIITAICDRWIDVAVYEGPPPPDNLALIDAVLLGDRMAQRNLVQSVLARTQYVETTGVQLMICDGLGDPTDRPSEPNRMARLLVWWRIVTTAVGCEIGTEPSAVMFSGFIADAPSLTLETTLAQRNQLDRQLGAMSRGNMYLDNVRRHDDPGFVASQVAIALEGWKVCLPPWIAEYHKLTGPAWAGLVTRAGEKGPIT